MLVTYDGNLFVARCTREERHIARAAGFVWHGESKYLVTSSAEVASRLRQYADVETEEQIQNSFIAVKPWAGLIPHRPELTPLPFQPGAARFALERNRSYLALDPGLGKTIVTALIMNALSTPYVQSFVVVVPPFLALNTREEFRKWLCWDATIHIYGDPEPVYAGGLRPVHQILIVPDSMVGDPLGARSALYALIEKLGREGATLFVDEAHRYKNMEAQRTQGLFIIARYFKRVVFLSGTPMPNRPMELYAILSKFAPETIDFKSERDYGLHYCAGYFDGFGYDFRGASNIRELAAKVRGLFMLRLRKKDVLRDLPDKTEELIFIAEDVPAKMAVVDKQMLKEHSPEDLMRGKLGSPHLSTYRRKLGVAKAPLAVAYIKELLADTDEAILIFAEHTEVIERLAKGLAKYKPVVITGKVNKNIRNGLVLDFQRDKTKRVFIGNIKACGVGFTITKATRVVFAEFSWVPGDNDQAADRTHRIGQKDHVLVQYLVFKNSFDRTVMETNLKKRQTTRIL